MNLEMLHQPLFILLATSLTNCFAQELPTRLGHAGPPLFTLEPDILVVEFPQEPNVTPVPIIDPIWLPPILYCPSIVSTTSTCRRCPQRECLTISTVTIPTYCPQPLNTQYVAHKCNKPCPTGCATTEYEYVPETPPELSIVTPTLPPDFTEIPLAPTRVSGTPCAVTVTSTVKPGVSGGCAFDCDAALCIADAALFLPCGCTRATKIITKTETACPTYSPCINCSTGWGIITINEPCSTSSPGI
jgi:hypothetical protein